HAGRKIAAFTLPVINDNGDKQTLDDQRDHEEGKLTPIIRQDRQVRETYNHDEKADHRPGFFIFLDPEIENGQIEWEYKRDIKEGELLLYLEILYDPPRGYVNSQESQHACDDKQIVAVLFLQRPE